MSGNVAPAISGCPMLMNYDLSRSLWQSQQNNMLYVNLAPLLQYIFGSNYALTLENHPQQKPISPKPKALQLGDGDGLKEVGLRVEQPPPTYWEPMKLHYWLHTKVWLLLRILFLLCITPRFQKNMLWAWSQLHQNQSAFLNDGDFLRLILSTKLKGHSLTSEFLTGIIMVSINTPNLDFEWFFLQGSGYYLYMIDFDENNTWHDWGYFAIPET